MSESATRRIVTEVVVIVGSILLAFALDAWWDDRQERARVDEMLDAVALEFEAEVQVLDSIIRSNETQAAFFEVVIERTTPDLPRISDDSLVLMAAGADSYQIYDPGFGALAALISTGGLEQVRDLGLQRRLSGWPAELDDLDWERGQVTAAVDRLMARATEVGHWLEAGDESVSVRAARAIRDDAIMRRRWSAVVHMYGPYTADLRRIRTRASELAADLRAR